MDRDSRAALWTFLGMAIGFNVATSVIIFLMQPSWTSAAFLVWMNWYWAVLPVLVVALPAMFWFRLMRVRARRRELIRSEWRVDSERDWNPSTIPGIIRDL